MAVEEPVESFLAETRRQLCLEVFLDKATLHLYLILLPLSSRLISISLESVLFWYRSQTLPHSGQHWSTHFPTTSLHLSSHRSSSLLSYPSFSLRIRLWAQISSHSGSKLLYQLNWNRLTQLTQINATQATCTIQCSSHTTMQLTQLNIQLIFSTQLNKTSCQSLQRPVF